MYCVDSEGTTVGSGLTVCIAPVRTLSHALNESQE